MRLLLVAGADKEARNNVRLVSIKSDDFVKYVHEASFVAFAVLTCFVPWSCVCLAYGDNDAEMHSSERRR